jgi:predicted kinase
MSAEIVLCCGKVGSGKSTFAKELQAQFQFSSFSCDDWMLHFYRETADRSQFDWQLGRCQEMIYRVSEQLLGHGVNVVLDFGFWKVSERETMRNRFESLGHQVAFVFFPIDPDRQIANLRARQAESGLVHYNFDETAVRTLNGFFEEPNSRERMVLPEAYLERIRFEPEEKK